jgi:hypothetical protein
MFEFANCSASPDTDESGMRPYKKMSAAESPVAGSGGISQNDRLCLCRGALRQARLMAAVSGHQKRDQFARHR